MKSCLRLAACLVALASLFSPLPAFAVPDGFETRGWLLDAAGAPVEGRLVIAFALYDGAVGGAAVWSESAMVAVVVYAIDSCVRGGVDVIDLAR